MFQIKWVLFLKILFNQVWSGCTFVPFAGLIIWQWYETFNGSGNFAPWGLFFWYALVAPLPHTSLIDGAWGRTFQKLSHLGRGYKIFPLERRDKPERGGGGWGGWCRTLQFNHIYCVWGKRFPLLLFGSSVFRVSLARFWSNSLLY